MFNKIDRKGHDIKKNLNLRYQSKKYISHYKRSAVSGVPIIWLQSFIRLTGFGEDDEYYRQM